MLNRRILFVANDLDFFLGQRINVALAVQAAGYNVGVVSPSGSNAANKLLRASNFEFYPITFSRWGTNPFGDLNLCRQLIRIYRQVKPELVHHFTIKPIIFGTLAARIAKVPANVCTVPGMGHVFSNNNLSVQIVRQVVIKLYRYVVRHPNQKIIFQNRGDLEFAISKKMIKGSESALIRGSGVNLVKYRAHAEPAGIVRVLLGSRLLWDKGIAEFVEAAKLLQARSVKAEFLIAGQILPNHPNGVPSAVIEKWCSAGTIKFLGFCDNMQELLASVHIACLPTFYGEGLPKFLIEASACSRALVACDNAGCREVVRPGYNGILVTPRDAVALANALERLICDAELRVRLGKNARELLKEEHLADEDVIDQSLDIYRYLLGADFIGDKPSYIQNVSVA